MFADCLKTSNSETYCKWIRFFTSNETMFLDLDSFDILSILSLDNLHSMKHVIVCMWTLFERRIGVKYILTWKYYFEFPFSLQFTYHILCFKKSRNSMCYSLFPVNFLIRMCSTDIGTVSFRRSPLLIVSFTLIQLDTTTRKKELV